MKARLTLIAILAGAALTLVGTAQAHVTVHPNALPSGTFTVINVNVPNEEANASTVRVDVRFPNGVYTASLPAMSGWRGRIITKKLDKPVEIEKGFTVNTRVDRVVFSGGRIGPDRFLAFPISILTPKAKAGTVVTFKAIQTYSNGKIVRWIGNPSTEEPAPQVLIRSAASPVLDYPAGVSAAKQGRSRTLKGVAYGIPLGALGAFLALRRRRKTA